MTVVMPRVSDIFFLKQAWDHQLSILSLQQHPATTTYHNPEGCKRMPKEMIACYCSMFLTFSIFFNCRAFHDPIVRICQNSMSSLLSAGTRGSERMMLHLDIFRSIIHLDLSESIALDWFLCYPLLFGVHEVRTFVLAYLLVLAGQSLARLHIPNIFKQMGVKWSNSTVWAHGQIWKCEVIELHLF